MPQPFFLPLGSRPLKGNNLDLLHCWAKKASFTFGDWWLLQSEMVGWISDSSSYIPTQWSTYPSDGAWNWSNMAPSWRTCFVGSGPTAPLRTTWLTAALRPQFSSWLVGSLGGIQLSRDWCARILLIPLPLSSSALYPFQKPHTQSPLNIAVGELPWAPGRSWLPSTSLKATFLSFSVRSLPWPRHTGLFFLGCDLRVPALATILAHSELKSDPREYMQSPEKPGVLEPADPGPDASFFNAAVLSWSKLTAACFKVWLEAWLFKALPHPVHVSDSSPAWPRITICPSFVWACVPQHILGFLSLMSRARLWWRSVAHCLLLNFSVQVNQPDAAWLLED